MSHFIKSWVKGNCNMIGTFNRIDTEMAWYEKSEFQEFDVMMTRFGFVGHGLAIV